MAYDSKYEETDKLLFHASKIQTNKQCSDIFFLIKSKEKNIYVYFSFLLMVLKKYKNCVKNTKISNIQYHHFEKRANASYKATSHTTKAP